MYHVYIIQCQDGTLYTGITTDVERRFKEHSSGKGGAYTRSKKVKKILYTELQATRSLAQRREFEIKSWSRQKKFNLAKTNHS
jgi:putative endonuclease